MDIQCKSCNSSQFVRNGKVRGKQRFKCKHCAFNFISGDRRQRNESQELMRCVATLLHILGRMNLRNLAKLLSVSPSTVYHWVKNQANTLAKATSTQAVCAMSSAEISSYIATTASDNHSSKPWLVSRGELAPGLQVVLLVQHRDILDSFPNAVSEHQSQSLQQATATNVK